jgi:hypothetical protein
MDPRRHPSAGPGSRSRGAGLVLALLAALALAVGAGVAWARGGMPDWLDRHWQLVLVGLIAVGAVALTFWWADPARRRDQDADSVAGRGAVAIAVLGGVAAAAGGLAEWTGSRGTPSSPAGNGWTAVALLAGVAAALLGVWLELRRRRGLRRRQRDDQRAARDRLLDELLAVPPSRPGELPALAEVSPYRAFRIAVSRYVGHNPYVARPEADAPLRGCLTDPACRRVLIIGDPKSGKSRTAYEAARALSGTARLIVPKPGTLRRLVTLDPPLVAGQGRDLLLLDNLERYLDQPHDLDSATLDLIARDLPGVVVLATIDADRYRNLGAAEGEAGRAAREVLGRFRKVRLQTRLTGDELSEARRSYPEERFEPDRGIGRPLAASGAPSPSSGTAPADPYSVWQRRALATWRLFDFGRDLEMVEVYVQEVLRETEGSSPLGYRPAEGPRIPEQDLLERVRRSGDGNGDRLFVLTGAAGSGKSTMLRNWVLRLLPETAGAGERALEQVPVYLALRHLRSAADAPPEQPVTPERLAVCFARTIPGLDGTAARRPFLQEGAGPPGSWLYLLDGFDELAEPMRPSLLHWIEGVSASSAVVLTSRPHVIGALRNLPRSTRYELCDFDRWQRERFIAQWFDPRDPPLGRRLIEETGGKPALEAIAAVPLLLTCLCIDVELRGDARFPEGLLKHQLLGRIVEIMVEGWEATKSGRTDDRDLIELAIAAFTALAATHGPTDGFSHGELTAMFRRQGRSRGVRASAADGLLERVLSGQRLLLGDAREGYTFAHQILFDYFFAEAVERERKVAQRHGTRPV